MSECECDKDHVNGPIFMALILLSLFIGFIFGLIQMDQEWKRDITNHGRSGWTVTHDSGDLRRELIPKK